MKKRIDVDRSCRTRKYAGHPWPAQLRVASQRRACRENVGHHPGAPAGEAARQVKRWPKWERGNLMFATATPGY